jgi:ribonuclease HI
MPYRHYPRRPKSTTSASLFPPSTATFPEDRVVAYIDGGARGNPGPAGFGVVIEDAHGNRLDALSRFLGHQTNNFAEYSGLLAALDYAVTHGHAALEVVSDSELMVKQINGQYKVRNPGLLDLYKRAKAQIAQLRWFNIHHVLRAKNKEADALANKAMDEGMGRKL